MMTMLRGWCCSVLLLRIVLLISASSIGHSSNQESLKSALDAVTRKQRSLDFTPRDYYNDLRNFKYHPNEGNEDKFTRQPNQDLEDDDEDLEFLPIENGQLENIGGGYQNFYNKRMERALLDYFENSSDQREPPPSSFRERERSGGHKRGLTNDRVTSNDPDKTLAALFYKELQNGPTRSGNMGDIDSQDYLLPDTLQSYYDRYRSEPGKLDRNKLYESDSSPMTWGEIFGKHESLRNRNNNKMEDIVRDDDEDDDSAPNGAIVNRERDEDPLYLLPAERRNVNGRYPLGREYGVLLKRYPLTKRSPKPLHHDKEPSGVVTDPKVSKVLCALFCGPNGGDEKNNQTSDKIQVSEKNNHDHNHSNHEHSDHDHSGHDHPDHDHSDHDHSDHDHSGHDHDHEKQVTASAQGELETTSSEAPNMLLNSPKTNPGQKEITNNSNNNKVAKLLSKRDQRHIELLKKNVDWSQYFGIDRRKKKAALLARPGSQDQDDEWMLQRYYKTMAENLKFPEKGLHLDKENGEKRDKFDQIDSRLKNVKDLIVQGALKYGNEDNSDPQHVKDIVIARLAAAYSLEKMRRALDEFRCNIAAQRILMKATHSKANGTNSMDESSESKSTNENKKRNGIGMGDDVNTYEGKNYEGFDEGRGCPELDEIEKSCRPIKTMMSQLYEPCVMHQICRSCSDEEECSNMFASEAAKVCESITDSRYSWDVRGHCARTALAIWKIRPLVIPRCSSSPDFCLRRNYRYRYPTLYNSNALDSSQLRVR